MRVSKHHDPAGAGQGRGRGVKNRPCRARAGAGKEDGERGDESDRHFERRAEGEADRYPVLQGGLTLNTPIVIYSWGKVVDALMNEKIVSKSEDGVYFITDMNKLINYILESKKWSDIGIPELYGSINIASTDPVTSSPGATYYGLLLSILCEKDINDESLKANLPKL